MTERRSTTDTPAAATDPRETADDRRQPPRPGEREPVGDAPPAEEPAIDDQDIDTAGTPADPEHATRDKA